jgi:transcriptional regulator of arginine metabolism
MQPDRHLSKAERQRLVSSLVERLRLRTQQELLVALEGVGCRVTQATVSRDIRELGLVKTHDSLGGMHYVLPNREQRADPRDMLETLLRQFGRQATWAENIVVVQSEIGSAPAIARALDRLEHPLVIGTLAGDDTCLIVARDAKGARRVAKELLAAIG